MSNLIAITNKWFRPLNVWLRNNTKVQSHLSPRKIVLVLLLIFVIFYYALPYIFSSSYMPKMYTSFQPCGDSYRLKYEKEILEHDVVVSDLPKIGQARSADEHFFPFVGNGLLGSAVLYEKSSLYIYYKQQKDAKTKLIDLGANVLIQPVPLSGDTLHRQDVFMINFRQGIVERAVCFPYDRFGRRRIVSKHIVIAHRSRPNVLFQKMVLKLESTTAESNEKVPVQIKFDNLGENSPFLKTIHPDGTKQKKKYSLYSRSLLVNEGGYVAVVVATTNIPSTVTVTSEKEVVVESTTVVMKSQVYPTLQQAKSKIRTVVKQACDYIDDVINTSSESLLLEHTDAWKDILHTGLSIAQSHHNFNNEQSMMETGIPDPLLVNATIYYILSSMDSKLHDKDINLMERQNLMKRLKTPDFCYTGVATFHSTSKLWKHVISADEVIDLANTWAITLNHRGCANLLDEGAEGMLQAVVLSFGGLQFTKKYLQLQTDTDILHNEIAFHSVLYQDSLLDVAINTGEEGSVTVSVKLIKESNETMYACEAGCLKHDDIVELNKDSKYFPVYVTKPQSPILYLSYDKNALREIHESLHIRSIIKYEDHLDSIQNKGGLPWKFWVGIGSVVIVFHLLLIRFMVKEYYSPSPLLPTSKSQAGKTYFATRSRLMS